jgi:hypothetical protein
LSFLLRGFFTFTDNFDQSYKDEELYTSGRYWHHMMESCETFRKPWTADDPSLLLVLATYPQYISPGSPLPCLFGFSSYGVLKLIILMSIPFTRNHSSPQILLYSPFSPTTILKLLWLRRRPITSTKFLWCFLSSLFLWLVALLAPMIRRPIRNRTHLQWFYNGGWFSISTTLTWRRRPPFYIPLPSPFSSFLPPLRDHLHDPTFYHCLSLVFHEHLSPNCSSICSISSLVFNSFNMSSTTFLVSRSYLAYHSTPLSSQTLPVGMSEGLFSYALPPLQHCHPFHQQPLIHRPHSISRHPSFVPSSFPLLSPRISIISYSRNAHAH